MTPLLSFFWVLSLVVVNFFLGSMFIAFNVEWDDRWEEPSGELYEWLLTFDPWIMLVWLELWPVVILAHWIEQKKKTPT